MVWYAGQRANRQCAHALTACQEMTSGCPNLFDAAHRMNARARSDTHDDTLMPGFHPSVAVLPLPFRRCR